MDLDPANIAIIALASVLGIMIVACICKQICACCNKEPEYTTFKGQLASDKLWIGGNPTDTMEEGIYSLLLFHHQIFTYLPIECLIFIYFVFVFVFMW